MIKAIRGTRDLLPPETALWNFVESAVRDVFRVYNFHEIRTPIFEETQLFARSVGEETDIVSKEMYTWEDGAKAADYAVYKKWMTNRFPGVVSFRRLDPNAAQPQSPFPTAYIKEDGVYVVFAYQATSQAFQELERAQKLKASGVLRFDQLRLVTADVVPDNLKVLQNEEVVIETITIDAIPQSLTLRPENTAGVVRAYIEHNLWDRGLNKLFYIGPQFRRERPQKGRYRQFYQIGAEVIGPPTAGSESPARDAEILELLVTFLVRLGRGLHHEVALHAQREQLPGQRHPDDGLAVAVLGQGQEEQPHDALSLRSEPGQPAMPGATRPVRTMPSLVPASSKEPPARATSE